MAEKEKVESERLKGLRVSLGLGIREMARELKVSPSTVCYWEKGIRFPNILACHKIIELAEKYGMEISVDWLRPRK